MNSRGSRSKSFQVLHLEFGCVYSGCNQRWALWRNTLEAPWMKARTTYPVWVLKTWSPGAEQGVAVDNRLLQWRKKRRWAPDWRPARAVALAARAAEIKSKVERLNARAVPLPLKWSSSQLKTRSCGRNPRASGCAEILGARPSQLERCLGRSSGPCPDRPQFSFRDGLILLGLVSIRDYLYFYWFLLVFSLGYYYLLLFWWAFIFSLVLMGLFLALGI